MTFVDSNIIIYAELADSRWHASALRALTDLESRPEPPWISRQVLRECLVALTRPQQGLALPEPADVLRRLRLYELSYQVAEDSAEVTRRLYELVETRPIGGKQIHDANVVATMLVHGIAQVLTHNVEDFRRFEPMIELLPLDGWVDPESTS